MTDQLWKIGTVTVTNGLATVTGDGTGWQTALVTGGLFIKGGIAGAIESVDGEEELTLAQPWAGASGSGVYAVVRETAEAVRAAWTNDRLAQIIPRLSLVGIHPDGSGTLTERDALDPAPAEGDLWLHAEPSYDLGIYRKTASGWDGPFPVEGSPGADSTVPGPPGEGFTPAGAWDSETTYAAGYFVSFGGRSFVSLIDDNLGNEPPSADEDDAYWQFVPVANGRTILSGAADPTAEGDDGDFYINTATQFIFGPKAAGTWPAGVDLNGEDGDDGIDGRTILSGAADPTTEGEDGDFYLNTSSQTLFGPKAGTWLSGVYIGPGSDGSDGAVWYTGATDPDDGDGADGDFYLQNGTGDTGVLGDVWTKAGGAWSITSNIRGASGAGTGDVVGPAGATDSRLVAFDGTTGKLIKGAGYTAAEIRNADNHTDGSTNKVFSATEKTKLAGIESGANVTDAANVDGAGAVMNSDTSTAGMAFVVDEDDLSSNSDTKVPTQQSVKAYADALIAANDAMVFKGVIDCSTDPNYPAADRGHTYRVSVAGKIGGASGANVEAGDILLCLTDSTSAGNQATVGSAWSIIQTNVDGAVIGPSSATDSHFAQFDGATGKLLKGGKAAPAGAVVGTSDAQTLSGKTLTDPAINGAITEEVFAITDGPGFAINPRNGSVQTVTLGANRTPVAAGWLSGDAMVLKVADGAGYAITWTSMGVVWVGNGGAAPTLATSGYTHLSLWKDGATLYGKGIGDSAS